MNMTLDTFRKYFLEGAAVVAVIITLLIGVTFILQLRESAGIIFGRLPKTEVLGERFTKDFSFELEKTKMPKTAKVVLVEPKTESPEDAKAIARRLEIKGEGKSFKDLSGQTYVKIQDGNGSLTYNLDNSSWSYHSIKAAKGAGSISTSDRAKEVAESFLKKLNLDRNLEIGEVMTLAGTSTHLSPTKDEKKARQFIVSFNQEFFDERVYDASYVPTATVTVDKSGVVVKAFYKPVQIEETNVGNYPIINLGGVEKRLKSGLGVIVFSDSETPLANLDEIKTVNFTQINLVYLADEKSSLLVPFWSLGGETSLDGSQINLTVLISAVVDKYMKEE